MIYIYHIELLYMPEQKSMAKLSQIHYNVDGKKSKKKITKKADALGYDVVSFNRGVIHYKNKTDGFNVINIKGTDITNMKDIVSDAKLGLGLSNTDKQFRSRRNEIKRIYRDTQGQDNYLVGHSLGGSIGLSSMVKSKSIRDNTKQAYLYNSGYTGLLHDELNKGLSKQDKKELKDKVIHYHTKGDVVSTHLNNERIGDLKVVKAPKDSTLLEKHSLTNFTGESDPEPESDL